MSSRSDVTSTADHDNPEMTGREPGGKSEPPEEERGGGLPTIRQDGRKKDHSVRGGPGSTVGGAGGAESDDATENGEGTVLPPIGGLKGKRDSKVKTQTFKTAGNSTLQKSMAATTVHGAMAVHGGGVRNHMVGQFGGPGGAIGASTSLSSGDAMSSTNPHSWAGPKVRDPERSSSPGSAPINDKMNSTWAPNHSHQPLRHARYVSPFGANTAHKTLPVKKR